MGVALVTPFNNDFTIDFPALGKLIDYQIANGADYLVVLATTSEAVTLTCPERNQVARFVAERVAGRIPLVMGMSSNSTIEFANHIREVDFTGYSAILSVVPYYNKPSQEGTYQHFRAIAEASPIPVVLYNVPSRTGRNMEAATTLRLANDFPDKIIGIKEASGNTAQIAEIIANKPAEFQVVSGDDSLTLTLIRMGAVGVISVIANALPQLFGSLVHGVLADANNPHPDQIDQLLQPLDKALFAECNPSGIKCLLAEMGLANNVVRLPLVPVNAPVHQAITNAYFATKTAK
jgi:4-hydroxy-tetrahydrodipicolinate synthase